MTAKVYDFGLRRWGRVYLLLMEAARHPDTVVIARDEAAGERIKQLAALYGVEVTVITPGQLEE